MSIYHQILGIPGTASVDEIKTAYKTLCKKYHPDLTNDQQTAKMALINEACSILTGKKNHLRVELHQPDMGTDSEIIRHKNPAYVFYKQGLDFFNKSDFNFALAGIYGGMRIRKFRKAKDIEKLDHLILKSLYYFNLVCIQYPESPWYSDSIDKIKILNRRKASIKLWLNSDGDKEFLT